MIETEDCAVKGPETAMRVRVENSVAGDAVGGVGESHQLSGAGRSDGCRFVVERQDAGWIWAGVRSSEMGECEFLRTYAAAGRGRAVGTFAVPAAAAAMAFRVSRAFSSAWSMLKLDGLWRGGKSRKVFRNSPTMACAATSRNARFVSHLS